jgi:hypothetical protein
MSQIEQLLAAYTEFVGLPWQEHLAGPQKVWFAVYDPNQERRLRLRVPEFELATRDAGHKWIYLDIGDSFARWMAAHKYRDIYFQRPDRMGLALRDFETSVSEEIKTALTAPEVDENTVVAVGGVASLFGLTYVSTVLEPVTAAVQGRLLVFFPGRYENGAYRLLDARDGWNYLAVPITASS